MLGCVQNMAGSNIHPCDNEPRVVRAGDTFAFQSKVAFFLRHFTQSTALISVSHFTGIVAQTSEARHTLHDMGAESSVLSVFRTLDGVLQHAVWLAFIRVSRPISSIVTNIQTLFIFNK